MVRGRIEGHIHVRQLAHNGGQALDRQGDRAAFLDLSLDPTTDSEIQVGRGEGNLVLLRLDQDIAQDRHRGLGADDVEHLGQPAGEMIPVDFEFHEVGTERILKN